MTGDDTFGSVVRRLRKDAGLRQEDLAARLGVGRSTLANIERGAEAPSPRVWSQILEKLPEWQVALQPLFDDAREAAAVRRRTRLAPDPEPVRPFLGGPFHLERVSYTYVFQESRSPSEIIEVRRVRALEPGTTCFGLLFQQTDSPGFRLEQQALWGGELAESVLEEHGRTAIWRRFDFGRRLRVGEAHEFAIRSWVEHDPVPATEINFTVTRPTTEATINLAFHGSQRPAAAWRYGPWPGEGDDVPLAERTPLRLMPRGSVSARFKRPAVGPFFGVFWSWEAH